MQQKCFESDPQCTRLSSDTSGSKNLGGFVHLRGVGGEQKGEKEQDLQSELSHLHRATTTCLLMANRGVFDIFAESFLNKELEETKRLIFSNSHMTIDLLSPIIWGVLLSLCLLFVAMAFENKSKFFGLTNGRRGDRTYNFLALIILCLWTRLVICHSSGYTYQFFPQPHNSSAQKCSCVFL